MLRVIKRLKKVSHLLIKSTFLGAHALPLKYKDNRGAYIQLIIDDNGVGIKEANKTKILEPYFTTKKSGTGLGLAISKKIIEDHHGEIIIESSEKGTIVNIKFPIDNK